jgi:hypothetical protein
MKPAPVTPAAPLDESMATAISTNWSESGRSIPTACAMNSAASVM